MHKNRGDGRLNTLFQAIAYAELTKTDGNGKLTHQGLIQESLKSAHWMFSKQTDATMEELAIELMVRCCAFHAIALSQISELRWVDGGLEPRPWPLHCGEVSGTGKPKAGLFHRADGQECRESVTSQSGHPVSANIVEESYLTFITLHLSLTPTGYVLKYRLRGKASKHAASWKGRGSPP